MLSSALKRVLPNRAMPLRIWRGPFRGARIVMNPRNSLRKVFGLYEHELNHWLERALRRVNRVLDVGANDGYFTFGCAAAFRRLGKSGEIIAFEPGTLQIEMLHRSAAAQQSPSVRFSIFHTLVGRNARTGTVCLDEVNCAPGTVDSGLSTLIKIDVEGDEVEVIEGARSWLKPSNLFVIEIHTQSLLNQIQKIFTSSGLNLIEVNQKPIPLFGRETREVQNWWLVSRLD
jgi:hypothetical protein